MSIDKIYYKGKEMKRDDSAKNELWLDLTDISEDKFTLEYIGRVFDAFVKVWKKSPSLILINHYQRGIMASPIFGEFKKWRDVPVSELKELDPKRLV